MFGAFPVLLSIRSSSSLLPSSSSFYTFFYCCWLRLVCVRIECSLVFFFSSFFSFAFGSTLRWTGVLFVYTPRIRTSAFDWDWTHPFSATHFSASALLHNRGERERFEINNSSRALLFSRLRHTRDRHLAHGRNFVGTAFPAQGSSAPPTHTHTHFLSLSCIGIGAIIISPPSHDRQQGG